MSNDLTSRLPTYYPSGYHSQPFPKKKVTYNPSRSCVPTTQTAQHINHHHHRNSMTSGVLCAERSLPCGSSPAAYDTCSISCVFIISSVGCRRGPSGRLLDHCRIMLVLDSISCSLCGTCTAIGPLSVPSRSSRSMPYSSSPSQTESPPLLLPNGWRNVDLVDRVLVETSFGVFGAAPRVFRELSFDVTRLDTRDSGLWRSGLSAGAQAHICLLSQFHVSDVSVAKTYHANIDFDSSTYPQWIAEPCLVPAVDQ